MFETFAKTEWGMHRFTGNAGLVVDTDPHDTTGKLKVMICGHADKIRMQVRQLCSPCLTGRDVQPLVLDKDVTSSHLCLTGRDVQSLVLDWT